MIAISSRTQNRLKWLFHKLEYCIYMAPATARYKTHELRPFPIRMDRLQVDIILFILFWGERGQTIERSLHPSPIHPYNRYQSNCVGILSSKITQNLTGRRRRRWRHRRRHRFVPKTRLCQCQETRCRCVSKLAP